MSINRSRAKLNKAHNNHEDKILWLNDWFPIYWDEGITFKGRLMAHEVRACRTWKHNRKTQWK